MSCSQCSENGVHMDFTIKIAGEAGQGLQTMGAALAKILCRMHYHVFTHQDYMSRVRGGHNFYQIRISDKPLSASRTMIHILVALNPESIDIHYDELHQNGVIIYDPQSMENELKGDIFLPISFEEVALDAGGEKIMANSVAIGAVLGIFQLEMDKAEEVIRESLAQKSDSSIEGNISSMHAGYRHSRERCRMLDHFEADQPGQEKLLLMNGTSAIGFGAVSAGCKFYSAYPMTPATGIMVYLAAKSEEFNIVVEQAEDEISAINMALGASYAGVRSMTGTSGGGFALMTEGVSLAGMTETPVVICEMQRPGPATGLPTRTEQGDLLFVIHSGHGEFPRVVLTPGTPQQAFHAMHKAFNLSEKYQIPVFVLGDQYLGDCEWTMHSSDFESPVKYHDYRLRGEALAGLESYRRYALNENGISPLAVPGESEHLVLVDSDEHDEDGHIIEDSNTRVNMVEKRLSRKIGQIRKEIAPPDHYGAENSETVLIGFGSTFGVIKEVVDLLSETHSISMLHFSEVYPFPLTDDFDYLALLQDAQHTITIEVNATGQFAGLLHSETGFSCSDAIHHFDGRPFTTDELLEDVMISVEGR